MIDLSKIKNIAVVGTSTNPDKYGYKVVSDLLNKGFNVYPVNPKGGKILNLDVYKDIASLPKDIELLDIVTSPQVTINILRQAKSLGLLNVWVQPGAEDKEIIEYLKQNNFEYIVRDCIMV